MHDSRFGFKNGSEVAGWNVSQGVGIQPSLPTAAGKGIAGKGEKGQREDMQVLSTECEQEIISRICLLLWFCGGSDLWIYSEFIPVQLLEESRLKYK